jgi:hypothetical protein
MYRLCFAAVAVVLFSFNPVKQEGSKWISLFDGRSFDGWKVGANKECFTIENGTIAVNGEVSS